MAEKLGVSRQTISKWETNETIPDIYQSKKMARLYNISVSYTHLDVYKRQIPTMLEHLIIVLLIVL